MDNDKFNLECNIIFDENQTSKKTNADIIPSITNIESNSNQSSEKCDKTPENLTKVDNTDNFSTNISPTESNPEDSNNTKINDQCNIKDTQTTKDENMQFNISNSISLQEIKSNEKSDDIVFANELKIEEDNVSESSRPNSFAFIIDFNDNKAVDKKKYNNLIERFQTRHVRGKSLSKIDNSIKTPNPSNVKSDSRPTMSAKLPRRNKFGASNDSDTSDSRSGVILRGSSATRDPSKRHSWGPRTSAAHSETPRSATNSVLSSSSSSKSNANATHKYIPPSKIVVPCKTRSKEYENPFSLELICPAPPLENYKHIDDELVSEAGTYTLDGDNYTEEQKDKMNIDKLAQEQSKLSNTTADILEIIDLDDTNACELQNNRKNVLEISIYHNEPVTNVKPKISYLDKIKSRVKNIGDRKFNKSSSKSPEIVNTDPGSSDVGSFTSVTTSGILSVKPSLERNPKITRKNSLTKSQIDSSEYVQGISRLNLTCENDQIKVESGNFMRDSNYIGETNLDNNKKLNNCNDLSSTIKVAATKNDWIQEWAKYAREYAQKNPMNSLSNSYHQPPTKQNHPYNSGISKNMSRSYDFENYPGAEYEENHSNFNGTDFSNYDEEFGDNLERSYINNKRNNHPERYRNIGNYNYSSDTNLKYYDQKSDPKHLYDYGNSNQNWMLNNNNLNSSNNLNLIHDYDNENVYCASLNLTSNRPPMSPSKIPSPIHSISRARGTSRTRSQNEINPTTNDTEMYLQKTAAAINTLQNIHRQNSLNNSPKSPSSPVHKISPKISPVHAVRSPIHITSPYNTIPNDLDESYRQLFKNLHQRNLSLDGSDIKITFQNDRPPDRNSHNYDVLNLNKTHTRHHSYEGMMKLKFDQTNNENCVTMRTRGVSLLNNNNKHILPSSGSPIKRSSSFSTKNAQIQKYGTKQMSTSATAPSKQSVPIKKSASSTSFRKMLGSAQNQFDDNNEMEFYINDDDDLDDRQHFSSGSELSDTGQGNTETISSTRYNKTALMRIEHSKKQPNAGGNQSCNKQGVIACPNTPELRRRDPANIRQSFRDRQSMPRDSSLSRLKQDLPNFNQTKKNLSVTSTTPSKDKILPKYMDISKYKQQGVGSNFLRKDESKSYLAHKEVKRSPSSASMNLNRNDTTRTSNRSIKSAGARPNQSKKEQIAQKTKETELALWKRRASYDPMKAANEGKKKVENAKRQAQQSKLYESSVVLRSQSFHSGVTGVTNMGLHMNGSKNGANIQNSNRWTVTSTESSDEEFMINS